ncbi:MAG: CAP domain-containing protein, partial [Patescibacteria group bacterium]|nr:CAP domain-containing protein [Patescibacteria group bacterium]
MGFSAPEGVVDGWVNSKTHYDNMIDPDYREIGVGAASGPYNDRNTTFVAQYFGITKEMLASENKAITKKQEIIAAKKEDDVSIPKINSQTITNDLIATDGDSILFNSANSKISVADSPFQKETLVQVVADLNIGAEKAEVSLNGYLITLTKDVSEKNKWIGNAVLTKEEKERIFNPVVLPTITVYNANGEKNTSDINISGVEPLQPSVLSQYFFIKSTGSKFIQPLLDVSSLYFKILALILFIALLLNIFIEIKKQHPHIIASSIGLFCLLVAFIFI